MTEEKFNRFKKWMDASKFDLSSKLEICQIDLQSNFGVRALEPILEGSLLFCIPRSHILSPKTTHIADLISQNATQLESASGWIPLIVSLAYETTVPESKWAPYLKAVPNFCHLELPMFWTEEELYKLTAGTGVIEQISTDSVKIEKEFREVYLPFVEAHLDVFSAPECTNLCFYKSLVAFVMAYSFTEPSDDPEDDTSSLDSEGSMEDKQKNKMDMGEEDASGGPFMVPMADMLNHAVDNNAAVIFAPNELRVEALRNIACGEEVTNTYGDLANWQLLSTHGFSLSADGNRWDTVDLKLSGKVLQSADVSAGVHTRWSRLLVAREREEGNSWTECVTPMDAEGIMNAEELAHTLHILVTMEESEFEDWLQEMDENRDWEEENEAVSEWSNLLSTCDAASLARLPFGWREILIAMVQHKLASFPCSLTEDEVRLADQVSATRHKDNRLRFALCIRVGQQRLLQCLLRNLTTEKIS